MEPLWSPAVATGGNRSQIAGRENGLNRPKTVAVGCHRLPPRLHGKEGVDGSSPSEGSAKRRTWRFFFRSSCSPPSVRWVWSLKWSFRVEKSAFDTCPRHETLVWIQGRTLRR
jgi:hypothetical protein